MKSIMGDSADDEGLSGGDYEAMVENEEGFKPVNIGILARPARTMSGFK